MRQVAPAFIGAVLAACVASAASAARMQATYTGLIGTGTDDASAFSAAGSDLAGDAFTAVFLYDTALGFSQQVGSTLQLFGGADFGYSTPVLDAWATVAGQTRHFSAASSGFVQLDPTSFVGHTAGLDDANGGRFINIQLFPITPPNSLTASFEADGPPGGLHGGGVIQYDASPVPGQPVTILNLTVQHVSVAALPEPATWALGILGFGFAGVAIRRQKPRRSPAT